MHVWLASKTVIENTEEARVDKNCTKDIPRHSFPARCISFVWKNSYNRSRYSICKLSRQQYSSCLSICDLLNITSIVKSVCEPHWSTKIIAKMSYCIGWPLKPTDSISNSSPISFGVNNSRLVCWLRVTKVEFLWCFTPRIGSRIRENLLIDLIVLVAHINIFSIYYTLSNINLMLASL